MDIKHLNSNSGQALTEFSLALILILIPFICGGAYWFCLEFYRSKCAYETFFRARQQLIQKNHLVRLTQTCGKVQEQIQLKSLEDLDLNKGALTPVDALKEVSQLWGDVLQFLPHSQDSDSSTSSNESTP